MELSKSATKVNSHKPKPVEDKDTDSSASPKSNDSYNQGLSKFVFLSTIIVSLLSFNNGYNTGVTNIPNDVIRGLDIKEECYNSKMPSCIYTSNELLWGFAIGVFALGGCFGCLIFGKISDMIGRRNSLILGNVPFIVGSILLSTTTTIAQLSVGRFIVGISAGSSSVLVSSYIGEISSVKRRGFLGSVLQFMVTFGIFVSNLLGLALGYVPMWRILFALTTGFSLIQIALLFYCKETPKYLIMKNKPEKAYETLKLFRKGYNIDKEFEDITSSENSSEGTEPVPIYKLFKQKKFTKLILVVFSLHILTQLSGINGVIAFSTSFFSKIFGPQYSAYSSIGLTFLNLIATMVSMYLIDKAGRRVMLLASSCILTISCFLIVIGSVYKLNYLVLVSMLAYIIGYAIGLGPIPWLLVSEIFPTRLLSSVTSISNTLNWLFNFVILLSFLSINNSLGSYTFIPFGCINAICFVMVFFLLPETKGKTPQQIIEGC